MSDFDRLLAEDLKALESGHLLRRRRVARSVDAAHVEVDGRVLVNFASNDYLGLSHHPAVIEAARRGAEAYGAGAGAAGLITGYSPAHQAAEIAIARWKGSESAVLLPSGYQANLAAIQTAAAVGERSRKPVRFLLDKLCHASLIDAVRGTGAAFRVFPHNHLPKLRRLLEEAPADELQIVVTESVFSMDGDAADLKGLAELKRERPFVLLLDEAHGSGVYGPGGAGYAAECGLAGLADFTIVTLSKAAGCAGGAVCGSDAVCQTVVNHGRAYVFSTAVAPSVASSIVASVDVMRNETHRQARVRDLSRRVRAEAAAVGWSIPAGDSPIVPIILGEESVALQAAERLREAGVLALAIRPPTVPRGSSRLRVTLSSEHSDADVQLLLKALQDLRRGSTSV